MSTPPNGKSAYATPWVTKPKISDDAKLRLFCFPYAGGGALIYRSWTTKLPMIEVLPVQLPGRETRMKETPYRNLPALVRATGQALLSFLDRPFCFFGHSMGALLAFELAREIRREYGLSPQHLFVAGRRAPTIPLPRKSIYDLPKQEFIAKLREMNGTVPEVLEHTELIELLLPMLQADFAICETYEYKNDEPLNCGITVFGGLVDHFVSREHLERWHRETLGSFKVRMLPGDHFFLHSSQEVLLGLMFRELQKMGSTGVLTASNAL